MEYSNITRFTDKELERYRQIYKRYRGMRLEPERSRPMFVINTPVQQHTWEEKLESPSIMLEDDLRVIKTHSDIGDDRVPAARVSFGTAQVAAAFGCEMYIPPNNLPCAKNHILSDIKMVHGLKKPDKNAGWLGKLRDFSEYFLENLPEGVELQLPDTQGTFNNAHLIRGNDIIFDFYDNPDDLCVFLDFITDYLIDLIKDLSQLTTNRDGWFFDWGCLWEGNGRISNCTVHLISPSMYKDFILERDIRFLESIGKGRIHYCGTYPEVIGSFINIPAVTGFDYDDSLHSIYDICRLSPENVPVYCWTNIDSSTMMEIRNGKWPDKRNVIYGINVPSEEEGKAVLQELRESSERFYG
ncbi:MAG TPA: uroporphyrinogen decarboxylase family protein [Clostridia bacterium]|nr:uroporphyrinogen decarboxylase family protein [Clostridia bacterium]